MSHAIRISEDVIYIHTRSDSKLFNLALLKAKSKIRKVLIRELLFADDAALTSHSAESLQRLIDKFADACKEFGLTISIKKTNIMGQDVHNAPSININEHTYYRATQVILCRPYFIHACMSVRACGCLYIYIYMCIICKHPCVCMWMFTN